MSKWTLEKINNCEEIKFGTKVVPYNTASDRMVVKKSTDNLRTVSEESIVTNWTDGGILEDFKFYRPDGTEIKPPKEVEIETLYECLDNEGYCVHLFTDGAAPAFAKKRKSEFKNIIALTRKTGKKLFINMETFEIVKGANQ